MFCAFYVSSVCDYMHNKYSVKTYINGWLGTDFIIYILKPESNRLIETDATVCSIRLKLRRMDSLDVREEMCISLCEKLEVEDLEMENQRIVCKKIYLW